MPESRAQRREAGLRVASAVQLKQYLRYQGLAAGMNDTKNQVIQRVLGYVSEGQLTEEDVDKALVEFLEYRNKRVHLYTVDPTRLRRLDHSRFTREIRSWAEANIVAAPASPRENYSFITPERVRVNFTETHRQPVVDLFAERVSWQNVGKVIVLEANRQTGFVSLSFDPPGRLHPHGHTALDYFNYYEGRAAALLGAQLQPFDLQKALRALEAGDLIRIPQRRGSGLDGSVEIVAAGADVRQMQAFQATEPLIAVRDNGRYVWVARPPDLLREVPTNIEARSSMIRFTKDSLLQEVQYVLAQVQAHS
jgi:hypothetical protein